MIVLVCAVAGSAVAVLDEVHTLRDALAQNPGLKIAPGALASAGWGGPQTLLLVGDDWRPQTKYYHVAVPHLANEMLLVRLDPSKPYISMMSIPRELWVTIYPPGGQPYTNRINSAYTYGITTLVSTIKRVLGLPVNHVVVATFGSFKKAVDAMGCVYSTVDRRYYHSNVGSVEQYQEINLQPGYQKMCGEQALEFVSYRHDDTSLVRDARDQSFLMDVKKQYGPSLVSNAHKFEKIFGKAVRTDAGLRSTTGILNLLGTLVSMSSRRVRQVHFQASLLATHDVATQQQIAASVHAFLHGGSGIPARSTAAAAHAVHNHKVAARLPLVPASSTQLAGAQRAATHLPFPLEYPRVQDRGGSGIPPSLRRYLVHAPDGSAFPIYVAVFSAGQLGAYYDVQGTSWLGAPMFQSPDQSVIVGSRKYSLYYEGSNLKMISWSEHGAIYWVRNSLTDTLSNGEMLAIAEQTKPFSVAGARGRPLVILKAAGVPVRQAVVQKTSALRTVGSLGGLLALISIPLLAFAVLRRRRDLRPARLQLAAGTPTGAWLSASVSHLPYAPPAPLPLSAGALEERRRAQRSVRKQKLVAGTLAALAVGVLAGVTMADQAANTPPAKHRRLAGGRGGIPTVPVSVLNASSVQGAAGSLALQLKSRGISIGTVANDTEARPPGLTIMYAAGERAQAARLSHDLAGESATLMPIDSATMTAAGYGAKLVVVIG